MRSLREAAAKESVSNGGPVQRHDEQQHTHGVGLHPEPILLSTMTITLELLDRLAGDVDERYLTEALVAVLYHNGKLSSKEGCDVLGIARREFEEMLPRYGIPMMRDTPKNIQAELEAGGHFDSSESKWDSALRAHAFLHAPVDRPKYSLLVVLVPLRGDALG